jgi:hypothetical protein
VVENDVASQALTWGSVDTALFYLDNTQVNVQLTGTLPSPYVTGKVYYPVNITGSSFMLTDFYGGSAIGMATRTANVIGAFYANHQVILTTTGNPPTQLTRWALHLDGTRRQFTFRYTPSSGAQPAGAYYLAFLPPSTLPAPTQGYQLTINSRWPSATSLWTLPPTGSSASG